MQGRLSPLAYDAERWSLSIKLNKMGQKMNCDCETCKNNKNFKVPKELINDFLYGKVAIFAGSGISTESKNVLKFTFYEEIASEIDQIDSSLTFPDLMEEYCKLPNGRLMLFEKIRSRFRNISSFPQLEGAATRFHREIATLYPIQNIVTTNWDTYFYSKFILSFRNI